MSTRKPAMLSETYATASRSPRLPDRIEGSGLLVGWSMEQAHEKPNIGFAFGDACSKQSSALVDPILFGAEGHLVTIASTGAGKGVGCIIPALLTHHGPMIVVDPKGENAAVTRRYREEVLGQEVHVIDPMDIVAGQSACLNPLDAIDPADPNCVDEAASLAESLSIHMKKDSHNQYWYSRGQHLVAALLLHAACCEDRTERTLAGVRANLGLGMNGPSDGAVPDSGNPLYQLLKQSPHPEVRRAAASVRNLADTTLGSIVSTAQDMVDFVRGAPVREATSSSSFSLEAVTHGEPMTIYIVLPPHMLESHAPLLRLWVNTLLKAIMRRRYRTPKSTMLILDEAAQLGEFPPLRQAITLMRGYGLQTWSFWQDVSQLKHAYPTSWETIINNCQVVQAFGAPNMSAAKSLADLFVLMRPETVLDLDDDEMIVQTRGDDAFIARRPNYLADPAFAGRFDENPLYLNAPPSEQKKKPVKRLKNVYPREDEKRAETSEADAIADLLKRYD
ncbi:type IV secretory system conjugative DNA transfer family protein [Erythrobacter litoralis]|uniref:type IV secretory system conjugative DNA transfer family protein n=1 Tax=Erythrobacter litoralis TaxID=39960 RepID=UPI0024357CA4|nr:type IV secretory system conjugative DNA transfer family protein [Erythrobacter litoralis]MDG6078949.1 type IV secretory system conjugative DNA transfer family protein [Erythrobacter litoralis]